jgi:pimeloyl-ACP methyl ester carboxylesterase
MDIISDRTNIDHAETSYLVQRPDYAISGIKRLPKTMASDVPFIIAIHGGTYTSRYFDIPGFSLLDRATALGIPIAALDRPGYGGSTPFPSGEATIERNAELLDRAIDEIWKNSNISTRGIFLIGHSIGGAVAVTIASRQPRWPLLGIAVSGVGLHTPPESGEAWSALPETPMINLPTDLKDSVMFGPQWTYPVEMPEASRPSDSEVPRAELINIVTAWPASVRGVAARVKVPVHYRQGEFDKLWIVDEQEVTSFGAAFSDAPIVDARLLKSAGHCIDFHRLGAALQLDQLAFALRCSLSTYF